MTSMLTDDAQLVRYSLQGQREAFGQLYDRHFPAVYDFLCRTLRNADEAADVTQEAFLRAMERLDRLADPAKFKPWLFSIAHNQALNRLERQKHTLGPPPESIEEEEDEMLDPLLRQVDSDRLVDPAQAAEIQESAALVWEAAEALDRRTYALLDLHVRQGLDSAEIAEALGVSKGNAYTMLNRMKKSLEEAIGAFVLARRGRRDCLELERIVASLAIPPVTPEARKAIEKHVRRCDVCTRTRKRLLSPLELFGAFAAVPVPLGLKEGIWGSLEVQWAEASAGWSSLAGGGGGEGGTSAGGDQSGGAGDGAGGEGAHASGQGGTGDSTGGTGGKGGGGNGAGGGFLGGKWSGRKIALLAGGAVVAALLPISILISSPWEESKGRATPAPLYTQAPTKKPTKVRSPTPPPSATPRVTPEPNWPTPTPRVTPAPNWPTPTPRVTPAPVFTPPSPVPTARITVVHKPSAMPTVVPTLALTKLPFRWPTATPTRLPTATATIGLY